MLTRVLLIALIVSNVSLAGVIITAIDANGNEIEIKLPARDEVDEMVDGVVRNFDETVSKLMQKLEEPNASNVTKAKIIYALGELRARKAIWVLIDNINLEAGDPSWGMGRWFGSYSAREALRKIGHEASWSILKAIGSRNYNEKKVDGYAGVLAEIETPRYALMKLQDRLSETEDENIRKRYEAVMDRIKTLVPPTETTKGIPQTIGANSQQQHTKSGRLPEEKEIMLDSLPNGLVVLPDHDLSHMSIFSFIHGQLQRHPFARKKAESEEVFFERVAKAGDLIYDDAEDGVIVIASRQVQSLGEGTLAELTGKDLQPALGPADMVPARLGMRYMVRTKKRGYAVFRIVAVARRAIMIQWIYQPDGSSSFRGTGRFLDRPLPYFDGLAAPMTLGVTALRHRGFRVCFEPAEGDNREGAERLRVSIKNVSVRGMFDELVRVNDAYQWRHVEGTNIICIYPRTDSLIEQVLDTSGMDLPIENRSWLSVLEDINLERYRIRFPYWAGLSVIAGMSPPTPPERFVSLDIDRKASIRVALAKLCWAYGDGMYFGLGPFMEGTKGLVFETYPSSNKLALLKDEPVSK